MGIFIGVRLKFLKCLKHFSHLILFHDLEEFPIFANETFTHLIALIAIIPAQLQNHC